MALLPIINRSCMIEIENPGTKNQVIRQMVGVFDQEGYLLDKKVFYQDVLDREDVFSTFIGFDIALPHGKSDAVKDAGICVAKLSGDVMWTEETHNTVNMIIMIAVKKDSDGDLHLQILSKLSRLLMHEDFRNELKNCSLDDLYALLTDKLEV